MFEGLEISKQKDICDAWMNQWPVMSLSLKAVEGNDFSTAYEQFVYEIGELYKKHEYLMQSSVLNEEEKKLFWNIAYKHAGKVEVMRSLQILSEFLNRHYHKNVILLIDEYDVPMAKATSNGYYKEMLEIMKGFMQALKDNPYLQLAVVTGCLKIAKESIFTGTNNFVSNTITSSHLNEYYGFVQSEVDKILEDAGIKGKEEVIKKWYDGYRFGDADVYCPWDVMCYIDDLQKNSNAEPDEYWKDTSDNAIIRSFIDYAGTSITKKMETLMGGGYIVQRVDENLTYDYLHSSEENLWSMMYLTGYLTRVRDGEINEALPDNMVALKIPNLEIKQIFETEVAEWFEESASKWNKNALFEAVWRGDCESITREMSTLLRRIISYHDYGEDFYHAFLSGIFAGAGYQVDSVGYWQIRYTGTVRISATAKRGGIRLSGPALGRPKKGEDRNKAQDYRDECERVEVERKFSLGKRKCGMGLVTAKLEETAAHVVALSILLLNLRKIQCTFLQFLDWLLGLLQSREKRMVIQ